MIKAIIFDHGGVLSKRPKLQGFVKEYGPKWGIDVEEFDKAIYKVWSKARIGKFGRQEFWEELAKPAKVSPEKFKETWINWYEEDFEMLNLVKSLSNYKLGILSDASLDWFEELLKRYKLDELFDVLVTSYEEGMAKPDKQIFKIAAKRLGVSVEDCVFVDDDEKNVIAANELGMKGILYKGIEKLKKDLEGLGISVD